MLISRRTFLTLSAATTLGACSWFPQRIEEARADVSDVSYRVLQDTELLSEESFEAFKIRLEQYNTEDNQKDGETGGNIWNIRKFQEMALPLLAGGLSANDVAKMQYLIAQEVGSAYDVSTVAWFRKFDAGNIYDPNVFFWNIPWESPEIGNLNGTLYDSRIKGQIDLNSPNPLLQNLWLPEGQQNVGFVIKDQNGMFMFAYYQAGKLRFVAPTSPGADTLGTTPSSGLAYGSYKNLAHSFYGDDYKRKKDENGNFTETIEEYNTRLETAIQQGIDIGGPMPFAHQVLKDGIPDGYYTHIGQVNGLPASHGCIRLPALWAYIMFYAGDTGANIYYKPSYQLSPEA